MRFLDELRNSEEGMKLLAEDNSIMHMLLKCFAKAKDLDRALELYETVRISLYIYIHFCCGVLFCMDIISRMNSV